MMAGSSTPIMGTTAYASNLTPDTATGIGGWADIDTIRAMRYGIDDEQEQLCPTMPRFDGTDATQPFMTHIEATAIVAYFRSFKPVNNGGARIDVPAHQAAPAGRHGGAGHDRRHDHGGS